MRDFMNNNKFISSYALFSSLVVSIIGVGIFSYPRDVAEFVSNDIWLITLIGGIINLFIISMIVRVFELNGFIPFSDILNNCFGKILGKVAMISITIGSIVGMALGIRVFSEVVKIFLLQKTPTEFIIVITLLMVVYLVRDGLHGLVRFNEITFFLMFVPLAVMLLFTIKNADFTNLLPAFQDTSSNYLMALKYIAITYTGLEIIYILLPFLLDEKKANKVAKKGILFTTVIYLSIVILCIAAFGSSQIKTMLWPTIILLKTVNIPGNFIERWEGIVITLWILFYFTSVANGFSLSSYLIKNTIGLDNVKISSLIVLPIVYICSLYPSNIASLYSISSMLTPILMAINILIIPILLYIISKNKVKVRGNKE
jgi:spore germination protein (amino acid permease)